MKTSKHPPGPRACDPSKQPCPCGNVAQRLKRTDEKLRAALRAQDDAARARLIAAAPDLLAALEEMTTKVADMLDPRVLPLHEDVTRARAAIARARGVQGRES